MSAEIVIDHSYLAEYETSDELAQYSDKHLAILYGWLTGRLFDADGLPPAETRMLRLVDQLIDTRRERAQQTAALTG